MNTRNYLWPSIITLIQLSALSSASVSCNSSSQQTANVDARPNLYSPNLNLVAPVAGNGLNDCGPNNNENCSTSLLVQGNAPGAGLAGGVFYRSSYPNNTVAGLSKLYPAQVSDVKLDKYEVTVGRFRQFVNAWVGGWRPTSGSGKHTYLNAGQGLSDTAGGYEPGWQTSWNNSLIGPLTWNSALQCSSANSTWTQNPGGNEKLPINCLNWYQAYAFCIWDGGFLPSEAESNYADAGGSQQRFYAWSNPASSTVINQSLANYDCLMRANDPRKLSCTVKDLYTVGSLPLGAGRWGQNDLGGNIAEWVLDGYAKYQLPCTNCANVSATAANRVFRGASFQDFSYNLVTGTTRTYFGPATVADFNGARCARMP